MTEQQESSAEATVDGLLAGLVGLTAGGSFDDPGIQEAEAESLVGRAAAEGLLGPLLLAVDLRVLSLPDAQVERAEQEHWRSLRWCLRLESRYLEVRAAFAAAGGIDHLVLKGPAVAHLDDLSPALRTFADIDLLVAERDLERAVRLIERMGAQRPWPERRPGFDRRFAKSVTMTMADGVEIDLHRTICDGIHGFRIPTSELFAAPDRFDLGGVEVEALAAPERALSAAYHAMLGSRRPGLKNLRDLADYLARPELADPMRATAARWRGTEVLAAAVAATLDLVPGTMSGWVEWAEWLAARTPDDHEVEIIERQRIEGSSFGLARIAAAGELASWRDRAAFAFALVWPTQEHLRARGSNRFDTIKQLWHRTPARGGASIPTASARHVR